MSDAQLQGMVAVITGASQGIGQAIASSLASEGVDVVMCSRSADALSQAVGHVVAASQSDRRQGRVEAYTADVRDPSQMDSLMAKAVDTFGRLDILINNAGVGRFQPLAELSVEDWRTVLETNLSGVFFACHAAIPLLRRGSGGWIINVSSLAGSHPFPGGAAYCASKAGLNALSEVLMQELRDDDIRVSCVAPGSVSTRFGEADDSSAVWKLDRDDVARVVLNLLNHHPRSLPSRVEIRPSRPRK
jgi:3-oxoacyl-[acyl-carrier protein] reductase